MSVNGLALDEIQWRDSNLVMQMGGIHSNTVLWYFANSPFYDKTCNNAVLFQQAQFNVTMVQYVESREALEGRLKTMSGLEFMVAEQPAVTGPGYGTGIWIIRKQTRRKQSGQDDIVEIHATYYVVGDNIIMAPTLADILTFRMTTISSYLSKCFPAADEATSWSPATGHEYRLPPAVTQTREQQNLASKEATPMPESQASKGSGETTSKKSNQSTTLAPQLADQTWAIHMRYGGEYMDENPITGKPGDFHLSSTGRKEKLQAPVLNPLTIPAADSTNKSPASAPGDKPGKDGKAGSGDKTPKTPTGGLSKSRRKKSKTGATPTAS
ncbi:MED6 mediator subfamily complex component [Apiospora arundinis]|uniref:Mediator of RNA polymerase II transcription subunit 6 n=1 Tax=Apiospora arundinis TaxID=335852 RepID=A0ABR2I246_9PEZI